MANMSLYVALELAVASRTNVAAEDVVAIAAGTSGKKADAAATSTSTNTSSNTNTNTNTVTNQAPTAVALTTALTNNAIAENTSTTSRTKVADIAITDDTLGTNTITLSGADAASFEVVGNALYLKAGVALNYESKTSYAVTVNVADSTVTGSTALSTSYTLAVTDVNEAPTVVALTTALTNNAILETASTTSHRSAPWRSTSTGCSVGIRASVGAGLARRPSR